MTKVRKRRPRPWSPQGFGLKEADLKQLTYASRNSGMISADGAAARTRSGGMMFWAC